MSVINNKVKDKKTGEICTILNIEFKYVKDSFIIFLKLESKMEDNGDILIFKRSIGEVIFV
jgi:hypothetical protein